MAITQQCLFISLSLALLAGCSSINIRDVEPEKLSVAVDYHVKQDSTALDVYLKRGFWQQPVTLGDQEAIATTDDDGFVILTASQDKGRYGFREKKPVFINNLTIADLPTVSFPFIEPVKLQALNAFSGELFFKDDQLSLELPASQADSRYVVATGYCGRTPYLSKRRITTDAFNLTVALNSLMKQINNAAEADLNGIIPVTLAIEERYSSNWPAPFEPATLITSDETEFSVDTSGFRFQAEVTVQLSSVFSLNLKNQDWPVQYCF